MQKTFLAFLLSSWVVLGCSSGEVGSPSEVRFVGLSAFSSMNPTFPCEQYINLINQSLTPIMPVLYGTFGFDWSCVEKFIESNKGRPHAVEIHPWQERCRYYQRCYEGEFEGDIETEEFNYLFEIEEGWILEKAQDRVFEILAGIRPIKSEDTTLFLSTGLEDLYSEKAYNVIYKTILEVWPYEIIRVPLNDDSHHGLVEYHGVQVPCTETTFASNDGVALSTDDIEGYVQQHLDCKATILWTPALQGVSHEFARPLDRVFRLPVEDVELWELFLNLSNG